MFKGFILGVVLTIAAGAAASYGIVVTGTIPAAANGQPVPLEHWAARSSLRATLQRDSPKGPNPVPLNDTSLIAGVQLYADHCAVCHGTAKGEASKGPISRH